MLEKIIKEISALAPFLAPYPIWVKGLLVIWVLLGATLILSLILARPQREAKVTSENASRGSSLEHPSLDKISIPIDQRPRAIINIFETGQPRAPYPSVFVLDNDFYYGGPLASFLKGELAPLLETYCSVPSAKFASEINSYLKRVKDKDPALLKDNSFHRVLRKAGGEDPVMVQVQDLFWQSSPYWKQTTELASQIGVRTRLGLTVLLDAAIHQGPTGLQRLNMQTTEQLFGTPITGVDERRWIKRFAENRHAYLKNSRNEIVQKTAFRTQVLLDLISENKWNLEAPLRIRNFDIGD